MRLAVSLDPGQHEIHEPTGLSAAPPPLMIAVFAGAVVMLLAGLIIGIGAWAGHRAEDWELPMGGEGHPLDGPDVIVTWNVDLHSIEHVA